MLGPLENNKCEGQTIIDATNTSCSNVAQETMSVLELMDMMEARFNAQQEKTESLQAELLEAKLRAQALEHQLQRVQDMKPQPALEAFSDAQLEELTDRLHALHEAKLLSDEDLCCLEDIVADCIEVWPTADIQERSVDKTLRMMRLSQQLAVDAALARQLRRKFV